MSANFAGGMGTRTSEINRLRLTWVLSIFVIIHLAHIALFWPYSVGEVGDRDLWRNGIITAHAILLLIGVGILLLQALARKKGITWLLSILPNIVGLTYLLGGGALAVIDQRVTASITPMITAAIGVAVVILIPPTITLINYGVALVAFLIGVTWVQTNPDIVLTTRVNAISATGLGIGLAILQWWNHAQSMRQRRRIDEQQAELEAKNRELTRLATTDHMTGLLNRAQFWVEGGRAVLNMQGRDQTVCLVMFDVDYFKRINDTYGHPVGDTILTELAEMMTKMLGPSTLMSRLGGEEFAMLLVGASVQEGFDTAERLRATIADHPFSAGRSSVHVTASFGVAQVATGSNEGLDNCYRAADQALYLAKNSGRNCVRTAPIALSNQPAG